MSTCDTDELNIFISLCDWNEYFISSTDMALVYGA